MLLGLYDPFKSKKEFEGILGKNEITTFAGMEKKGKPMLEDPKINIRTKLSALWVVLMLLYIYPDILIFMQPGKIKEIMG